MDGGLGAHLLGQGARPEQGAFDVYVEETCESGDIVVGQDLLFFSKDYKNTKKVVFGKLAHPENS